jgi:thiamine biosynthesis lipoprotein
MGQDKLVLMPATREVTLTTEGMILDLGGIAKGFAVDQARQILTERGIEAVMVVGGGEIAVGQAPPGAPGWKIALNSPGETKTFQPEYLVLSHANVSTSGDASQFVEVAGVRYSHVVDPRTGQALRDRRQVTVVASDGMTADASASALSVLGTGESARAFVASAKIAVKMDEATEAGWQSWTNDRWLALPKEKSPDADGVDRW